MRNSRHWLVYNIYDTDIADSDNLVFCWWTAVRTKAATQAHGDGKPLSIPQHLFTCGPVPMPCM